MAKAKVTKKQLLSSSLALVVSGAMLIGTTMAWFTDSVSTGKNIIQSGNLIVSAEIETKNGTEIMTGKTIIESLNFVPGQTESNKITIYNEGTVAASLILELTDIDSQFTCNHFQYAFDGQENVKTLLLPGESSTHELTYGISNEEECNVCQDASFSARIVVTGTQTTPKVVSDTSNLADLLTNATYGTSISLDGKEVNSTGNLELGEGQIIQNGEIVLDNTAIQDNYIGALRITEGDTIVNNMTVTSKTNASAIVVANKTGTATISDSTVDANFRGIYIVDNTNGTVNINRCNIDAVYPINVNSASSKNLVLNVNNSELRGWTSYGKIAYATFTKTTFGRGTADYAFIRPQADTTFTGCTFVDGFKVGAGSTGMTYTFVECKVGNIDLTADNFMELLGEKKEDNLTTCKIIVNNEEVKFN